MKYRDETEGQIESLHEVFESLDKRAQGKACDAIEELVAEGEEITHEFDGSEALMRASSPRRKASSIMNIALWHLERFANQP